MNILRIAVRLPLIGVHIIIGILLCVFVLPSDWNNAGSAWQRGIVRWWLRTCARLIGIRVHLHGKPAAGASLVVANHVSWMDVVIVGGLQPVSFLSKAEIARWPVIGYLARKAGTLFINRGAGAEAVAQLIGARLRAGAGVAFFPEGTTSDGTTIHRFHPRLFMAAINTRAPVQPVSITYPCADPRRNTAGGVHPKAPYTREVPFLTHALAIIGERRIHAVVRYPDGLSGDGNRKQLAEKAHARVVAEHSKNRQGAPGK